MTAPSTDYAVAPGEYLVEWLVENDVSTIDAAIRIGWAEAHVDDLINGRKPVDSATAALLERLTSIPALSWLSYEATYRADLVRLTTPATSVVPAAPEPLTTRLARLGTSMRENENKVLVAEAVEALHAAEPEPWVALYHRRVLDFVGGSDDVDLDTVSIISGYEAPYQYSEYTGGGGYFAINVSWKEKRPRVSEYSAVPDQPDEDGLYPRYVELQNEEVAKFLGSLDES